MKPDLPQHLLPTADAAVEVVNLSFGVATAKETLKILDDVSFAVAPGEFVSIIGPSGCGKSTVLNFIAGLANVPQDGHVAVSGARVKGVQAGVGYMFQSHGLLPWRSVSANVELGLELAGQASAMRRARATELLDQLGLTGFGDRLPSELSGGMRQRVALARTLANNPGVLLMDEPFGALDAHTKLLVQQVFLDYWEKHRTSVVFVTHDLAEAITLSDRIVVLGPRPARVKAIYEVDIPRPRDPAAIRSHPEALRLWDRLWADLQQHEATTEQGA